MICDKCFPQNYNSHTSSTGVILENWFDSHSARGTSIGLRRRRSSSLRSTMEKVSILRYSGEELSKEKLTVKLNLDEMLLDRWDLLMKKGHFR